MASLRSHYRYIILLILFVAAAYSNVYGNGFLLDDEFLLQKNRYIMDADYFGRIFFSSSTMGAGGTDSFYRPMQTLAYFIVVQTFGFKIPAIHALNVALHMVNAVLIFLLAVGRLRIRPLFAFCAALVWASHPLHTEAVTYMSATADPLHAMFVLLALLNARKMWLCNLMFVCGLFSKESAIVAPLLVMVLEAVESKRPFHWRTYLRTWPLWVTVVLYLIARKTFLDFDDTFSFYPEANIYTESIWYRTLTFFGTLPMYLKILLWPTGLHMERDFPVFAGWTLEPVLGALMVALAAFAVFYERNRQWRPWSLAALWFFMAHIPHTGVLLPVNSLFLEHWMYLPSIGLFLGLMAWFSLRPKSALPVTAVSVLAALALGVVTFQQNRVWASPIIFYENILSHAKGNARVHNNLGMAYSELNNGDKAIEHYEKAVSYKDSYAQVRHNLAEEFMKRGELEVAIKHLERALEINPRFYYSLKNLAAIYQRLGEQKKAEYYYNLYQQMRPE